MAARVTTDDGMFETQHHLEPNDPSGVSRGATALMEYTTVSLLCIIQYEHDRHDR